MGAADGEETERNGRETDFAWTAGAACDRYCAEWAEAAKQGKAQKQHARSEKTDSDHAPAFMRTFPLRPSG